MAKKKKKVKVKRRPASSDFNRIEGGDGEVTRARMPEMEEGLSDAQIRLRNTQRANQGDLSSLRPSVPAPVSVMGSRMREMAEQDLTLADIENAPSQGSMIDLWSEENMMDDESPRKRRKVKRAKR